MASTPKCGAHTPTDLLFTYTLLRKTGLQWDMQGNNGVLDNGGGRANSGQQNGRRRSPMGAAAGLSGKIPSYHVHAGGSLRVDDEFQASPSLTDNVTAVYWWWARLLIVAAGPPADRSDNAIIT
ncbi:hypothetical protein MCOR27_005402 [Pyricularia oryzae]|uniref:Uncharacterized protein n=1 Tax=Pyricularia grisea TaxID=148305 RepID=A0ABQ8N763_PYRGI|nr:hypothetical protein MCOR27_005402 [Pyricularia oryzae]KAI6292379.1 hypothetical protein MCOR33_009906 [Pyricularia grisea]KAI6278988.1 hypothetical protein MCOR26_004368 [Pyricularia oryzae]KAI6324634.1 hypothetical protein MCOR29_003993 [Pyricularia oryzae]KAI6377261.1 hypothetical protein MCOR31_001208 [Pyricularia oryzae]